MELKDKITASYVAFENGEDINSDLHDIRSKALQNFEELGFPTKKLEAWKYTSLNSVLKHDYNIFPNSEDAIELADVKKYFIHDIDTYKVVFINGKYSSFLSETTHDTIDVCLMSSALTKPKYKAIIEKHFNKIAKQDNLTALNTAFAN
ncbi:Fe-S cluster assembly protein SufD, partial [Tenacibaculum finnmarkense genomovar finnmarkense]|nr:Fe-S cluster assembly protein SufD [Tenacibaculum finnmarkense genomovar finnmarkense]